MKESYLRWVIENTETRWWHDSALPSELALGIERGAVGATTNPFLSYEALAGNRQAWSDQIRDALADRPQGDDKVTALMRIAVVHAARHFTGEYERSQGRSGYVCAQVNPARAGDRAIMLEMARRFHTWAPNIAVKLPATAAGLDVLEDCIAQGITCTVTVSYTVAQVVAVAERHRRGIVRARGEGIEPGRCFAVIMIGRLVDYLRDVAHDSHPEVSESDIRQAGLAVTKRAYALFQDKGYEAVLIIAALRGTHHMTELAGGDLIMSIAPPYQEMLISPDLPCEERIGEAIPKAVIQRLERIPEFIKAYDPVGLKPAEFIAYGVTQRTLTQFHESGWRLLERFRM